MKINAFCCQLRTFHIIYFFKIPFLLQHQFFVILITTCPLKYLGTERATGFEAQNNQKTRDRRNQFKPTGRKNSNANRRFNYKTYAKVRTKYNYYFPASTVVNAGISGNTVEAILYRVETMNFPKSVSNISLLCGTNYLASTSPSVISAKITKLLTAIFQKWPTALIHVFPNLPQFDHCFTLVKVRHI